YQQRTELMAAEDASDAIAGIRHEVLNTVIDRYIPPKSVEDMWGIDGLVETLERVSDVRLDSKGWMAADANLGEEGIRQRVVEEVQRAYEAKVEQYGAPDMRQIEKAIMIQQHDSHWREQSAAMDYL